MMMIEEEHKDEEDESLPPTDCPKTPTDGNTFSVWVAVKDCNHHVEVMGSSPYNPKEGQVPFE